MRAAGSARPLAELESGAYATPEDRWNFLTGPLRRYCPGAQQIELSAQ